VSHGSRGPVIIDTGVFGARLTPRGNSLVSTYRPLLEGRPAVISFITVAELRYGAMLAGWGPGRLTRLDHRWVAASAIWLGIPLVTHDAIFANVKDLILLTKLDL
jgi:predicted nucleic acid-binding protein